MMTQSKQNQKEPKKIKINEIHSKEYLDKLKKTTYKDEEVVFILPSGKEV